MLAQVEDAPGCGSNGAELWVTGAGEANDLATDNIFLGGKGETDEGGTLQVGLGSCG